MCSMGLEKLQWTLFFKVPTKQYRHVPRLRGSARGQVKIGIYAKLASLETEAASLDLPSTVVKPAEWPPSRDES